MATRKPARKPTRSAPEPPTTARIGRVTRESVLKCTGKDWDQWLAILDAAGARGWTHQEIVAHLKRRHRLGPWWQQGVTLGYELAIGRRLEGQNLNGRYGTVATRTLRVTAAAAWKFLTDETGLKLWVDPLYPFAIEPGSNFESAGGVFGEVRTVKSGKRIRLSWCEEGWTRPTTVQLAVFPRAGGKCMAVITHEGIGEARVQARMREHWKRVLGTVVATVGAKTLAAASQSSAPPPPKIAKPRR